MNFNLNSSPISGFSSLLYYLLIIKKKYRVSDVAKEMRIADDTLYRYARGENVMPPDRIVDLVLATGESEILDFFCAPCGYAAVPVPKGKPTEQTYQKDSIRLAIINGDALKEIDNAFLDGKIDRAESKQIDRALTLLQKKAAEIKEKVRGEVVP